jgi:putative transposase
MRLKELAYARPRYGYRRLTVLLQRDGWLVNHKRVYRIYGEEALLVRTKRRKKRAAERRLQPLPATVPGEHWSIDFVSDQLADGRRFRILTAIDQVSRECVCLEAAQRLPAEAVTAALERAMAVYGQPMVITSDNGTEFASNHFDQWAYRRGIELDFIAPGRPMENGFIESFNGKLRDECLSVHWFESLGEAQRLIVQWRCEYNERRPHSSLGNRAPAAYVAELLGTGSSPRVTQARFPTLYWP